MRGDDPLYRGAYLDWGAGDLLVVGRRGIRFPVIRVEIPLQIYNTPVVNT